MSDSILTVVAVAMAVLFALILKCIIKKKLGTEENSNAIWKRCKNGVKILFTSGQITASLPTIIPAVVIPKNFKTVVEASQLLNMNLFSFVPMECFTEEFSYYMKALALTMPLIVAVVGLILMGLYSLWQKQDGTSHFGEQGAIS